MSIILFGKLMVGGGTIAAVSVGYIFLSRHLNRDVGPYFVVVAEGTADSSAGSEFKCKMDGEDDPTKFPCKVEHLKWEDSKKHIDYSSNTSYEAATAESLKVANNVFKITIQKEKYTEIKSTTKKIEISSSTDNQAHVSAKILFTVENDGKKIGSTKLFVGKASEASTADALIDSYKCSWDHVETNAKKCKVFDFADTSTKPNSNEPFKKTDTAANAIAANNLYLIDWESENFDLQSSDVKKQLVIFYNPTNSVETTIKFTEIKPAFLIGEKLLILEANK